MDFYNRNLKALKQKYPHLATRLGKIKVKNIDVFPAKTGLPTLQIQFQGRKQLIHSKYDPLKEAATLINSNPKIEEANFLLVLGMGLGYPLFELVKKIGWKKQIIVIEPQLAFFKLSMELFDLKSFIGSQGITFLIGESIDRITAELSQLIDFASLKEVLIVEHPVSLQIMRDYFSLLSEAIKGIFVRTGGNLLTLMISATDYQMNTLANLGEILENPPIANTFNKFTGKPAVVISAGPSLDKNAHLLKAISDKAVLISVETAYKPLLARGIKPHFVIAADPLEENYRHLAGASTEETYLVAEPMTYPAILHNYQGRKFITTFRDVMMDWLAQYVGDMGFLQAWGSISSMGFDLARKLGCDPIILVGQDLSFPGNRKYCHFTHWEERWFSDYEGFNPLNDSHEQFITIDKTREAVGIDGHKVTTNQQLYAYRKWFEDEIKRTAARCFNATEGGVLAAKGLELISLKEAIYRFCREPLKVREVLAASHAERPVIDKDELIKALDVVLKEMYKVREKCLMGTELTEKLMKLKNDMNKSQPVYNQMQETIGFINEQRNLNPFLTMANQKGRYRFKSALSQIDDGSLATPEMLEKTSDIYEDFYNSIVEAVDFMRPNFEAALKQVQDR